MIDQKTQISIKTNQRPAVVVILGHVDHGKTSLLDKIRDTAVASKEAGGITQSIGAYEIWHKPAQINAEENAESRGKETKEILRSAQDDSAGEGRRITFIDTPGHEAFSKMRSRGAKVADLAILVVAADDGVEAQTKEAIKIIKETETPFIVVINKIDKPNAQIEKVKNQLTAEGVLLEGHGGSVSFQPVSAKTGEGINELLDLILLSAELEDLTFSPFSPAGGIIMESKLESKRGIIAIGIVKDGTLRVGDFISSASAQGKIKGLENFLGKKINEASPSSPVIISGFESLPQVGEEFTAGPADANDANQIPARHRLRLQALSGGRMIRKKTAVQEISEPIRADSRVKKEDVRAINLILKADVFGSLEAFAEVLKNLPKPEGTTVKIIAQSVGAIGDNDVKMAISSSALILGFKVSANKAASNLAKAHEVKIISSEIIYELAKAIELQFTALAKGIKKGELSILGVFGKKEGKQIVGGRVESGKLINKSTLEIERNGKVLGECKVINLQQGKKDSAEVPAGNECGLLIEAKVEVKVGDRLILR